MLVGPHQWAFTAHNAARSIGVETEIRLKTQNTYWQRSPCYVTQKIACCDTELEALLRTHKVSQTQQKKEKKLQKAASTTESLFSSLSPTPQRIQKNCFALL